MIIQLSQLKPGLTEGALQLHMLRVELKGMSVEDVNLLGREFLLGQQIFEHVGTGRQFAEDGETLVRLLELLHAFG